MTRHLRHLHTRLKPPVVGLPLVTAASQQRFVAIRQTVLAAVASKGANILIGLLSVPLTLRYLGAERYGLWATLSTLLMWVRIADFGIGNGLTNILIEAEAKQRPDLARKVIATTFWVLLMVMLALLAVLRLAWWGVAGTDAFDGHALSIDSEFSAAFAVTAGILLLSVPLSITSTTLRAYQQGMVVHSWEAVANIISLLGLLLAIFMGAGVVGLVAASAGSSFVVAVLATIWLFCWSRPGLRPRLSDFDRSEVPRLFTNGFERFVLQISALVLFESDNLIIAKFVGVEAVGPYALVHRMFYMLILAQTAILAPFSPAYADAAARNEWSWITWTFKRTLVIGMVVVGVLVGVLLLNARVILHFWTGGRFDAPTVLILLMAIWTLIAAWGNTFAFLQMGLGRLRMQVICSCLMAGVNLLLSILWGQRYGVVGVLSATIVSYTVTSLWPIPIDTFLTIRRRQYRTYIR